MHSVMAPSTTPASVEAFVQDVLPLLRRAVRGKVLVDDTKALVKTERWNSFDQFHRTTRTLTAAYRKAGAKAEVYQAPTGGALGNGRWIIPEACDIRSATLDVLEPVRQRFVDYRRNPWQIAQWSAATPREGIVCPLVVVNGLDQLKRMRDKLRGKMVLTSLDVKQVRTLLCALGAAGVISDHPVKNDPSATMWAKFGWGGLPMAEANARLVGLVLSPKEGEKLRALAAERGPRHPVKVKARVDLRRYAGHHDVVSGLVRGRDNPQDEVWAVAHSAEPGAADNASGVAVCIGIARVLEKLIKEGKLPRPRRTIRLLSGYECYGFFHYLEHRKRLQPPMAGVCIDTVGVAPAVCDGHLHWHATVPGSADFVDRLGEIFLRETLKLDDAGYSLAAKPFVSTEDTLLGDPRYGFPCPWITNHPFRGYHSSADTPEVLHPRGLASITAAMAAYLYYLADAGTPEADEWSVQAARHAAARLAVKPRPDRAMAQKVLAIHAENQGRLRRWWWQGDHADLETRWRARLADVAAGAKASLRKRGRKAKAHPAEKWVPRRTAPLSPSNENLMPGDVKRCLGGGVPKILLYWADGRRTLGDIAELNNAGRTRPVPFERVLEFFEAHQDIGYVKLDRPSKMHSKARLVRDLKKLGVRRGMLLMVHSSLSQLGAVDGSAETVVDALLEAVGPDGTLVMPSFNHFDADVYNPLATPTTNGAIPDAFWRRAETVRSIHPSHAVAAQGPRARELCEGHLENGIWAAHSPIGRLLEAGGYVLGLGVDHNASTAYHLAEIDLRAPCLDPFGSRDRIVDAEGRVRRVRGLAWRGGSCPVDPRLMNDALDKKGVQRRGAVGDAPSLLVPARAIFDMRRAHLKNVCPTCTIRPQKRK